MSFVISKLFWFVASPDSIIVLLLAMGWLLGGVKGRCLGGSLLRLGIVFVLAITFLPIGDWLLRPLEMRFPRSSMPNHVDGVVVLGGGIDERMSVAWGVPKLTDAGSRLVEAALLARKYPGARLLYSGGSASLVHPEEKEADTAAMIFTAMGIGKERVLLERRSRNTWENAIYSKDIANPAPGEVWLLVTSAFHMPRAVGIFRRIGWDVIPDPVGHGILPELSYKVSFLTGLEQIFWAMREWIGLAYYRIIGRTGDVFPGPLVAQDVSSVRLSSAVGRGIETARIVGSIYKTFT